MATTSHYIKDGWVWLLALLIFFFNTVAFLPEGLTLVLLLTPAWVYYLYTIGKLPIVLSLLLPLAIYAFIHIVSGVNLGYYLLSSTMLYALFFFIAAFYFTINSSSIHLDKIFKDIAVLNFFFIIISIILLFIPSLKELIWYMVPISKNIRPIPRLKLFTSEASHYSFLLSPIAIYFFSKSLFFKTKNTLSTLLIVSIPLLLSFSLGVLSGLLISGLLVLLFYSRTIFNTRSKVIKVISFTVLALIIVLILFFIFPHNPLYIRLKNVFNGSDTSAKGRTFEAFMLAHKIAGLKSIWWGIGPGQLKILGRNIIIMYYNYVDTKQAMRIPNATAETIAYFGYSGLIIRLSLELIFFVATKVYNNPYRLWLFFFVFIYQFTGSYITNANEYILWVMVFSNIFPEFLKQNTLTYKTTIT